VDGEEEGVARGKERLLFRKGGGYRSGNIMILDSEPSSPLKAIDFRLARRYGGTGDLPLTDLGLEGTPWCAPPLPASRPMLLVLDQCMYCQVVQTRPCRSGTYHDLKEVGLGKGSAACETKQGFRGSVCRHLEAGMVGGGHVKEGIAKGAFGGGHREGGAS
jgi:hypothetical protein